MTSPSKNMAGFGFNPEEGQHHFEVLIPNEAENPVQIFECPQLHQNKNYNGIPPGLLRTAIPRTMWDKIAEPVKFHFNFRLKESKSKIGAWKKGTNFLSPHLGKELTLLGWTLEDLGQEKIPAVIANWMGLVPEERWWLYSIANAPFSDNSAAGRGVGWRKAIRIAFSENPVGSDKTTSSFKKPMPNKKSDDNLSPDPVKKKSVAPPERQPEKDPETQKIAEQLRLF